jgi:TonB family protein
MMIHAVLFAALTCGMRSTVEGAEALLSKADAAIAQRNSDAAKADYNAAMNDLQATTWFGNDKACDPGYTLERYTAILHSLDVAVNAGIMAPFDAYQHMNDMRNGLFKALPPNASDYFAQRYPDVTKREWQYISAMESAVSAQKVAAHNPQGPNCQWPNVEADVLQQAQPDFPDAARGIRGTLQAVITVNLSAEGQMTSAAMFRSTGNMTLDQAALAAARQSTYLPAVKDCKRVPGTYYFKVTYETN